MARDKAAKLTEEKKQADAVSKEKANADKSKKKAAATQAKVADA